MLYSALCINNTNYFESGTITVRVFEYYGSPRTARKNDRVVSTGVDNLATNINMIKEGKDNEEFSTAKQNMDFEAVIFAPFGGGRNYGSFVMPQVNEKGVVAFLDGAFSKPIWMGSYFDKVRDIDMELKDKISISTPNDHPDNETIEGDSVNTMIANENVSMVIRTKHTEYDESATEKVDWANTEEQTTENLISVSDKRVRVRHYTEYDGTTPQKYQEVMIHQDPNNEDKDTVELQVNNIADKKQSYIKITEDGFNLMSNNNGDTTIFKLGVSAEDNDEEGGGSGSTLYFKDKDGNSIIGKNGELWVNGKDDSIVLYPDLKTILEKLMEHIHIGVVPTKGPLTPKKAPLNYKKEMKDMEATLIKSKHE